MSSISPGTILLGIVAVLFGLLGAYMVQQNLKTPEPPQEEVAEVAPRTVSVPMASTDLKAGRQITLGDIGIYRMTAEQMKAKGIDGPFMNNTQQIIGRVLKEDLKRGSVFETGMFYAEGTGPDIGDMLEPGQRAITVPVEIDAAVAGFTSPGTWVDVMFRTEADETKEWPETTITLLERVKVLALDQETFVGTKRNVASSRVSSAFVTLAVTPEDANAIGVVSGRGSLSLALRNPEDDQLVKDRYPRTLDELLNIRPPSRHRIEVYRGRQISAVEFNNSNRTDTTYVQIAKKQPNPNPKNDPKAKSEVPKQSGTTIAVSDKK